MTPKANLLVIDDDLGMCQILALELTDHGFTVTTVQSAEAGLSQLAATEFDVVVTDLNMRGTSGIELCRQLTENRPSLPVLVITAFGSLETAIAALRAGAYDFLTKPFEIEQLVVALERAIAHRALRQEVQRLRQLVATTDRFDELVGNSPAMQSLYTLLDRVAETDASVLIRGETGTGKELVARALHKRSRRATGPFVALNCAAMPSALLESELFGYEKGAFTDAKSAHLGLLAKADGGVLFLDEIGDMPLDLQPKLLRALEERRIRPVGGTQERAFDVRLIVATNRDLEDAVERGLFREDLLFRIDVIEVQLPPLRARGHDILLLAQHYLEYFASRSGKPVHELSAAAAKKMLDYPWPGNIRELRNCLEHAVALTQHAQVVVEDLPRRIAQHKSSDVLVAGHDPSELLPMADVEKRYILRVMEAVNGNKALAARVLGFDRRTLYRKLESYGYASAE